MVLGLAVGFDLLLGDPVYRLHPVRLIGNLVTGSEHVLRRAGASGIGGGILLTAATLLVVPAVYVLARWCLHAVTPWAALGWDVYVTYSCLALRDMAAHAKPVAAALRAGDVGRAREALKRIVGRDVARLDEAGISRAAVESVAESFVDGFLAPVFWFVVAAGLAGSRVGTPLPFAVAALLVYRCANTLDSMVGYRNARYLLFGRAAARTDDVLNWLPARLSLVVLAVASMLLRLDTRGAWLTALRDRRKHASPNSGHAESFVAGALGVKLGGPTIYPYGTVDKPWLGDGPGTAGPDDVDRVCRLTLNAGFATAVAALLLLGLL